MSFIIPILSLNFELLGFVDWNTGWKRFKQRSSIPYEFESKYSLDEFSGFLLPSTVNHVRCYLAQLQSFKKKSEKNPQKSLYDLYGQSKVDLSIHFYMYAYL